MLKKRLVGLVVVKDSWAVQSFGFHRYLPLGKPECIVENLDRWEADEILVLSIDRSKNGLGPDFSLLEKLANLRLKTPLIYGGGISSLSDALKVIRAGADRIVVDTLLQDHPEEIKTISENLGAQAVIASIPVIWKNEEVTFVDYRTLENTKNEKRILENLASGLFSEVLLQDLEHEGIIGGFDMRLIEQFPVKSVQLIAFGGISEPETMTNILGRSEIAAIGVGNFLNYREHAVQYYKQILANSNLRKASFETGRVSSRA
jgi:cyclase